MDLFGGQTRAVTCKLDVDAMAKTGMPITRILEVFEVRECKSPGRRDKPGRPVHRAARPGQV